MLVGLLSLALVAPATVTFSVEGVQRSAIVHPGTAVHPPSGRPLVLAFHGHGGNSKFAEKFAIHTLWPEAVVVYPEGLPTVTARDPEGGRRGWQNGAGLSGDRDLKFVDAILAQTKGYDPKRVYAMGFSNGGGFTFVLWSQRRDRFAAFAPGGSFGGRSIRGLAPAPALVTIGEADPAADRQRATLAEIARIDGVDLKTGRKSGFFTTARGRAGVELAWYVHPGGHEFPSGAAEATVEFFRRHT